jgi:serine/threonine protein kinase
VSTTSPVAGITILDVLGHGGFSVVYRCRQESVGREVALKIDNRSVQDDRDRRRFLREAHAAGRLSDHPNVISVFDAGITDDGRPYLVMELCPSGSLADRLRTDGPLPAADVREVGVRIADALESAHQVGVLHRDLKPANILVNRWGTPGLADFGLAASHDPSRQMSATLEALTPAFAAPEVFRMERPTTAVDIYSLGATLYALLSGRPPRWPATGHPSIATIIELQHEPLPDLPGVPGALVGVLRKAMASDPAARFATAADFRDALRGVALDAPTGMFTAIPAESPVPVSRAPGVAAPSQTSRPTGTIRGSAAVPVSPSRTAAPPRPPEPAVKPPPATSRKRGAAPAKAAPEPGGAPRPGAGAPTPGAPPKPAALRNAAAPKPSAPPGPGTGAKASKGPAAGGSAAGKRRRWPRRLAASLLVAVLGAGALVAVAPGAQDYVMAAVRGALSREQSYRGADPVTITSYGFGPFRVGEPIAPLINAGVARRPFCARNQLVAVDGYRGVTAYHREGLIRYVVITRRSSYATRSGIQVDDHAGRVLEVAGDAGRYASAESHGVSYLVHDGGNGLLFVTRRDSDQLGRIIVGETADLAAIGEGRRDPVPC